MVVVEQELKNKKVTGRKINFFHFNYLMINDTWWFIMIPIRCSSCGKPVSVYFDEYNKRVGEGENSKEVLDDLGLNRYCCRKMLITNVETW